MKAHLRGDGIDLSSDSGSINKQQASGFKAEETHLYFSPRLCIWIPELGRGPGQMVGHVFLTELTAGSASTETKASDIFPTVGSKQGK